MHRLNRVAKLISIVKPPKLRKDVLRKARKLKRKKML